MKCFAKDLLQGLQYLHSNGIVFCDLKPSNILLNEYGDLKLSDFGMARKLVDLLSNFNDQESKKGTPYYMAPELFEENGVHSFQSDMWALGVIMYELATGVPPYAKSNFSELVSTIQTVPF